VYNRTTVLNAGRPFPVQGQETIVMSTKAILNVIIALLVGLPVTAAAEDGTKASIEKKLTAEYALTKATDDKTDIVTAGSVLVLQKDKMMMVTSDASTNQCPNTYKDGKLQQPGPCKANESFKKLPSFLRGKIPGSDTASAQAPGTRTFVTGEKFWLTKIEVRDGGKDKGIYLEFFTDAIKEVRYKGSVMIPIKGNLPSPDDALKLVAEVVTVAPSEDAKDDKGGKEKPAQEAAPAAAAAAPAAEPAPAPVEAPPPIEAPPPPAPEPATVELGQTPDQVVAALGQPTKKAKVGPKETYYYKDMKVVFLNGKVKDIQ
jgi:hypothetical protein